MPDEKKPSASKTAISSLLKLGFLATGIGVGVIALVGTFWIDSQVSRIIKYAVPKYEATLELEINIKESIKDVLDFVLTDQAHEIKQFEDNIEDFRHYYKIFEDNTISEKEKQSAVELKALFDIVTMRGKKILELRIKQREKIIERRKILNDIIDKTLDDKIQKDLEVKSITTGKRLIDSLEMEINVHELVSATRGYLIKNDEILKDRVDDSIADFERSLSAFLKSPLNDQQRKYGQLVSQSFKTVKQPHRCINFANLRLPF